MINIKVARETGSDSSWHPVKFHLYLKSGYRIIKDQCILANPALIQDAIPVRLLDILRKYTNDGPESIWLIGKNSFAPGNARANPLALCILKPNDYFTFPKL